MDLFQSQPRLPNCLFLAVFLLFIITAIADEETGICKPITWSATDLRRPKSTPTVWERNKKSLSVANIGKAETGQINCRYPGGTAKQCCNAETWTCGDSPEDCAPGTCYEGACPGDKLYSTDGTCGIRDGNLRMCAGKWGGCCNMDGVCGTGPEFCSMCMCSMGNCIRPNIVPAQPLYMLGNTTDGTCGGKNNITCNVVYGNCCNKDGICGQDCGEGCQDRFSRFGTCNQPSLLQQIQMQRQSWTDQQEAEQQQIKECQISMANAKSTTTSAASTSTTTV